MILDAAKANLGRSGLIGNGPFSVVASGRWPAGLAPIRPEPVADAVAEPAQSDMTNGWAPPEEAPFPA